MAWLTWGAPPALYRRVVVNLVSDTDLAIGGVLWQARGAWLVLRKAEMLRAKEAPVPIDGEVLIHRGNVSFIEVEP